MKVPPSAGNPSEGPKPFQARSKERKSFLENVGRAPHVRCTVPKRTESTSTGFDPDLLMHIYEDVQKAKCKRTDPLSAIHYVHTHEVADWIDDFCIELEEQEFEVQDKVYNTLSEISGVEVYVLKKASPTELATYLPMGYKIAEFLLKRVLPA